MILLKHTFSRLGLLVLLLNVFNESMAQNASSDLLHQIESLKNTASVLYIAAHPDDENTRLISYLTKYRQVDVSYLSLTRGDGGQNLIGTEIGEGLGLIRTNELLAARKLDGGHQYFTRAIDFGYSKTAEESFNIWDKDAVLSDVVWVIRKTKPDVIITRFSPEENPERSTHGHHTASAQLALLAFEYAADPKKYPEQLKYVAVHKTKKIFWNTSFWFYGSKEKMDEEVAKNPNKYLKMDVNPFLPLIGQTCSDISAMSRSQHKSQGFGSAPALEEQMELLQLLKGEHTGGDLFSDISSDWSGFSNGKLIDKKIASIAADFDLRQPENSVTELLALRALIGALPPDKLDLRTHKLSVINSLIVNCLGLHITAFVKNRKFVAGEEIAVSLDIQNHAKNRLISLNGISIPSMNINEKFTGITLNGAGEHKDLKGTLSKDFKLSQPFWLSGIKTTGSYTVPYFHAAGMDVEPYFFQSHIELTIDKTTFNFLVPVMFSTTDPVKGQVIQPITIVPAVMLNLDKEVYVFTGDVKKTVAVDVISGEAGLEGYVELNLPNGWKAEPAFYKTILGPKGEKQVFSFVVTAPINQESAKVRAMFKTNEQVYTNGLVEIIYDHIPHQAYFPTSEAEIRKINLVKKGNTIGYIMGAGDKVPDALGEMGYLVTPISLTDVLQKPLNFDAVIFGIRAFNTLDEIESVYTILMKYVESGGNVLVQYNTAHALKSKKIGPYNITLSRDRVTEEDATVTILKPDHAVVNTPNKIDADDFNHWVQERGLYFPSQWDAHYDAILSMHDKGEEDRNGSLLVTKYGKGYFVYTGISFFRELPAGVPGAYRLLANILSLGK